MLRRARAIPSGKTIRFCVRYATSRGATSTSPRGGGGEAVRLGPGRFTHVHSPYAARRVSVSPPFGLSRSRPRRLIGTAVGDRALLTRYHVSHCGRAPRASAYIDAGGPTRPRSPPPPHPPTHARRASRSHHVRQTNDSRLHAVPDVSSNENDTERLLLTSDPCRTTCTLHGCRSCRRITDKGGGMDPRVGSGNLFCTRSTVSRLYSEKKHTHTRSYRTTCTVRERTIDVNYPSVDSY